MKRFFLSTAAIALLATTAAQAGEAEFHPSTYTTYKKHGPYSGSVKVLEHLPQVGKYTEIGMVRINSNRTSTYNAVDELKAAAAKHGGTAIVLEDDAKIFMAGGTTPRGTKPENVTAVAVITH